MIVLKNLEQIEKIRRSCSLVSIALSKIQEMTQPGISTEELDSWAENFCYKNGAKPAFKGYKNFPYTLCTSVNSEVVHGMPGDLILKDGDILSVDFGVLLDGYYGDSAITIPVGNVSPEALHLIKTGQECLYKGIEQVYEGNRLNQISHAIQSNAEENGYSVVRQYVGHGIGADLHEPPQIFNFTKKPNEGVLLKRGFVIAIEPMVLQFSDRVTEQKDGWTVRTKDDGLAVHWEHTVAITEKGTEILTLREKEKNYEQQKGNLNQHK
jgi:methionyl aminopeptidase